MADRSRTFLRDLEVTVARGEAPRPAVAFAVFGKHPAWDDHMDPIGLATESLVYCHQSFYVRGIGAAIDSGVWEKDPGTGEVIEFDHWFAWNRDGGTIFGRILKSVDGRGRTKYPLICCAQVAGFSATTLISVVGPILDDYTHRIHAAKTREEVAQLSAECQTRLVAITTSLPADQVPPWANSSFKSHSDFGSDGIGWPRIVHELRSNFFAFSKGSEIARNAMDLPAQTIRLPLAGLEPRVALFCWLEFFHSAYPAELPALGWVGAGPNSKWVDVSTGSLTGQTISAMRQPGLIPASETPYSVEEATIEEAASLANKLAAIPASVAIPNPPSNEETPRPALTQPANRRRIAFALMFAGIVVLLLVVMALMSGRGKKSNDETIVEKSPPGNNLFSGIQLRSGTFSGEAGVPLSFVLPIDGALTPDLRFSPRDLPTGMVITGNIPSLVFWAPATFVGTQQVRYALVSGGQTSPVERLEFHVTNSPPTIQTSNAEQILEADRPIRPFKFVIHDVQDGVESLDVRVILSGGAFFKEDAIKIERSAGDVSVNVTPPSAATGRAEMRLVVRDKLGMSSTNSFVLVRKGLDKQAPTVSTIADQLIEQGQNFSPIEIMVEDDVTAANDLKLQLESSDSTFLDPGKFQIGRKANKWLLTPPDLAGKHGNATVVLKISDGDGLVTVREVKLHAKAFNHPPKITRFSGPALVEAGTSNVRLELAVTDAETPSTRLVVTPKAITGSELISNLKSELKGTNFMIELSTNPEGAGNVEISVLVDDGEKKATNSHKVKIAAGADPVIRFLTPLPAVLPEGTPAGPFAMVVEDLSLPNPFNGPACLSKKPELLPSSALQIRRDGDRWLLDIKPLPVKVGIVALEFSATDLLGRTSQVTHQLELVAAAPTNSLGIEFVWVDGLPGTQNATWRGRKGGGWVGKFEVTKGQHSSLSSSTRFTGEDANEPWVSMNFIEASRFCEHFTARERSKTNLPPGWKIALPTVEQWEFFASGATLTNSLVTLDATPTIHKPRVVGGSSTNRFGLYDILGNVGEMTSTEDGGKIVHRGGYYGSKFSADGLLLAATNWASAKAKNQVLPHLIDKSEGSGQVGLRLVIVPE